MTNKEAIKVLEDIDFYARPFDNSKEACEESAKIFTALHMGIKALEQESRTGHWYDKWGKDGCSVCNEGIDDAQTFDGRQFKYCPMCGARMEE